MMRMIGLMIVGTQMCFIKDMGVTGIDWHQSINVSTSSLS